MRLAISIGVVFAIAVAAVASAQEAASTSAASPTVPKLPDVGDRILELVIADQWDRGNDMFSGHQVKAPDTLDWDAIAARDREREAAVRTLLASDALRSGREYQFAALIFQHSGTSDGLGLAHVLAMTAVSKGNNGARWLAAATLDRYLHAIGKPQIFGTQFVRTAANSAWTMDPYDRTVVPDSMRAAWCVVPVAQQDHILQDLLSNKSANVSTSLPDCH